LRAGDLADADDIEDHVPASHVSAVGIGDKPTINVPPNIEVVDITVGCASCGLHQFNYRSDLFTENEPCVLKSGQCSRYK
jgi:hypothetical protein